MPKAPAFRLALVCSFAFLTAAIPAHADPKSYDETLVLPADANPGLKTGLGDILGTLQKMTGREFKLTAPSLTAPSLTAPSLTASAFPAPAAPAVPAAPAAPPAPPATPAAAPLPPAPAKGGIRLMRATDPLVPADIAKALKGTGPEAYYIRGDAKGLQIVANGDSGFVYGLYNYLERLGARWFLPNDNWTILPNRTDMRLTVNKLSVPAFKVRTFFGTGGPGTAKANRHYDLANEVPARWDAWKVRNGLGGEFSIGGHGGEDFNTRNKAELLKHPEYLAEIGGVHVPWSVGAKPDVSNPGLVELYVNDRVMLFERQLARNPNLFAITVEPADGGGYCTSGPCTKIGNGSASDQTFYLANQVAKAVAKKWPGKHVSLLAYGEHILPPSFDLEPNVYVSVTPYGFNYTEYSGDELLALWAKKLPQLGLYDYWGIPDWSNDMPNVDFLRMPAQKIRYWHKNNVIGYVGESSISAGTVGITWYLASRLLWDPTADTDALLKDFYNQAFGPAQVPMKRMLERWSSGFLLTDHELGLSCRDWTEARRLAAGDEAVLNRLDDYGRYLHYLRLWYEFRIDAKKSTAPRGTAYALLNYMWNIYDSGMIEPFRMSQLVAARYAPTPENQRHFNMADKNAEIWTNIRQLTRPEIEALLAEDTAAYQPLDFEGRGYGGALVPLPAPLAVKTRDDKPIPLFLFGNTDFTLQIPPGIKSVPFTLGVGRGAPVKFRLQGASGKIVQEATVEGETTKNFTLDFPLPGRYTLKALGIKTLHVIYIPPGIGFTTQFFITARAPRHRACISICPKARRHSRFI